MLCKSVCDDVMICTSLLWCRVMLCKSICDDVMASDKSKLGQIPQRGHFVCTSLSGSHRGICFQQTHLREITAQKRWSDSLQCHHRVVCFGKWYFCNFSEQFSSLHSSALLLFYSPFISGILWWTTVWWPVAGELQQRCSGDNELSSWCSRLSNAQQEWQKWQLWYLGESGNYGNYGILVRVVTMVTMVYW